MMVYVLKGNPWRTPTKLDSYNSSAIMLCKFISSYCNSKVYQLIFIKFTGSHPANCYNKNKKRCFPVKGNLFIAKAPVRVCKDNDKL